MICSRQDLSKLIETTDTNEETKRTEEVHRIFRSGGREKNKKVEHRPAQYNNGEKSMNLIINK